MTIHENSDTEALKNNLNCFMHFYLFQSINNELLLDLLKMLLNSFRDCDLEILIFMMHNIGL